MKVKHVSIIAFDDGCIGNHEIELHLSDYFIKLIKTVSDAAFKFENQLMDAIDPMSDCYFHGISMTLPIAKWDTTQYAVDTTIVVITPYHFYVKGHAAGSNILLESEFIEIKGL